MRILLLGRFRYSRAMNHIFSLATELNRQGATAVVVITHCPPEYLDRMHSHQYYFPCFAENRPEYILRLARHYRFDLLHLHDISLAEIMQKLRRTLHIPCGITLHGRDSGAFERIPLRDISFIITPYPAPAEPPAGLRQKVHFIPDGIDLENSRPAKKEGFKITFIGEENVSAGDGATALLKAAGLAGLEVELICPKPLPLLRGRYHGWPLNSSAVLAGSQIVVGQLRGLLEGAACGNAALILGQSYRGLFDPFLYPDALSFPDLSGAGAESPCYRSIFFDLSALLRDRPLLESLQLQGRRFVRENCNLRLVAEQTCRLYRRAIRK